MPQTILTYLYATKDVCLDTNIFVCVCTSTWPVHRLVVVTCPGPELSAEGPEPGGHVVPVRLPAL